MKEENLGQSAKVQEGGPTTRATFQKIITQLCYAMRARRMSRAMLPGAAMLEPSCGKDSKALRSDA